MEQPSENSVASETDHPAIDSQLEGKISSAPTAQKTLCRAYLCWMIGGLFGLHHFYLRRDRQAFLCWSTFGGYVFGWLGDAILIPEMVRDANNDPRFVDSFKELLRKKPRPPFTIAKFTSTLMVAYLWAQIFMIAVPDADFNGRDYSFLHALVPVVVALAVWTVGNCGRQQGRILPCLLAAFAAYPLRLFVQTEQFWLYAVIVVSSMAFEYWSKEWLLTPPPRRSLKRRVATLYVCGVAYLALFGSYAYFNAKITTGEGDVVSVHETIASAMNSSWMADMRKSLGEEWAQVQHRGYYATLQMIWEQIDTDGESKAYQTLGLDQSASQPQITAAFRRLSKENHPDKAKGTAAQKREAQERFMAISQAYEKLSQMKSKRRQRNRKSTATPASDSINL